MRLKNILLGVSLVSVATVSQAQYLTSENCDYFSGPYMRASALYQSINDKYTVNSSFLDREGPNLGLYMGHDAWGGSLGLGYGRLMNRTYIGAEAYAEAVVGKQKLASVGGDDQYLAIKTPFTFGAMAKIGYLMTPQSLVYVGLGAQRTQFRLTGKLNDKAVDLESEHRWGIVPSLGMDVALNCNWRVGARLSYAHYKAIGLTGAGNEQIGSINPRRAAFNVNVTYSFV